MIIGRRVSLAILTSLGLHLLVAASIVGSSLSGAWPQIPVDVEINDMSLEDLQDLPLGSPASGDKPSDAVLTPPPRAPLHSKAKVRERKPEAPADSEAKPGPRSSAPGDDGGVAPPRPTSVRAYAPRGSRVTALLRIDRLRGTVYAPLVDALLLHLPDRRDLLEGTDLDLYRDVDALLIATPNPLDARVTFLAIRHRITDTELRAALERGARATGRRLAWRIERGRPFAERRSATPPPAILSPATPPPGSRDQRLILLVAPHLMVVTPPAYRSLILGNRANGAGASPKPDGGGAADGGPDGTQRRGAPDDGSGWTALLRRIDAEDSVMPASAVAMVSVVDLFAARGPGAAPRPVGGTRGAVDEGPMADPTLLGLPVPAALTVTLGVTPQPFADLDADFVNAADALRWEQEWPALIHKLLTNPLVIVTGFSGLIGRATLVRSETSLRIHVDATEQETTRILEFAATQMSLLGH